MKLRILDRIDDVAGAQWDALLAPDACPLLRHGYVSALEISGSIAGFEPRHLTLWEGETLVAAAPCYLKHGAHGDQLHDWAGQVARKHALPYGPTLFIGVPYTSFGGPKLLTGTADRAAVVPRLIEAAKELISTAPSPVIHLYLSTDDEVKLLERQGFQARHSPHGAWVNDGYRSFDDFLARFPSRRRSELRKERRKVVEAGVHVRTLRGAELTDEVADLAWRAHHHTFEKYATEPDSFTRDFFFLLNERFRDHFEIAIASRGTTPLACAVSATSRTELVGRHWGALEDLPFLHFEVTYHMIDEAIARGLARVDTGGLTEHKRLRGFVPVGLHHSASWVGDEELADVFGAYVQKERAFVAEHLEAQARRPVMRPLAAPDATSPEGER